jgi:uncharacterized protein YbjT (DUF2867 family)
MRVAVFGATGDQGMAQIKLLQEQGHEPVAISRTPAAFSIDNEAVETRAADFADVASIDASISGTDAVFLNLPSTSFQAAEPLISAARDIAAAAARSSSTTAVIFNTSMPVPTGKRGFAAQDARHDMRAHVLAAGVNTVIIQPVVFLDNLMKGWALPQILNEQTIVYPHALSLEVSWICHDDLARLMIAAAQKPELSGRIFDVGGPQTFCLPQLAQSLSNAWGRPLDYRSQPIDLFCRNMRSAFADRSTLDLNEMVRELSKIYEWYNLAPEKPFRVDMTAVLHELPIELTSAEDWARQQLIRWPT